MPDYDLQGMIAGRVANEAVDMLRIVNEIVWEEAVDIPTYTLFEGAAISGMTSHNDSHVNAWCANQFIRYAGADLRILEVGIYIPSGSILIGQSGVVGVQFNESKFVGTSSYSNSIGSGSPIGPLVAGWNWAPLSSPPLWTASFPYILAAYKLGIYYLHNTTFTSSAVGAPSALFELDSAVASGGDRSWYAPGSAGNLFGETSARTYGIDIRVREA